MQVGEKRYFVAHAYYHFCGVIMEIVSPRRVKLRNVVQVHSCQRSWTAFFAEGFKNDTKYDVWPDGTEIEIALPSCPFEHEIPTRKP